MPDSENKKRRKVNVPRPDADDQAARDESSLYGDEGDIPLRRKKAKPKQGDGKAKKGVKAKASKSKARGKKAARRRKGYRSLFELMSATGSDSLFKPLRLFGREIRFWPLFLAGIIALLAVGVMLNNSNLTVAENKVTIVGLPEALEMIGAGVGTLDTVDSKVSSCHSSSALGSSSEAGS